MDIIKCPICSTELSESEKINADFGPEAFWDAYKLDCPVCGIFNINNPGLDCLSGHPLNQKNAALLSHTLRNIQKKNSKMIIDWKFIENILKNKLLPTPAQQADNLILWLGENSRTPGAACLLKLGFNYSIIGAIDYKNYSFIIDSLSKKSFLEMVADDKAMLTFTGWERFEELKKGQSDSRKAFMAMPFNRPELDEIVNNCFKPAVERTGFKLIRLNEVPKAGLIDDRLRVEIRTSKFLISELTHGNLGAYWEAGFAEGLGKPVIYTCQKEYFEKEATHFDTNHHLTVRWDETKLQQAEDELVATIRATLPEDAKMTDD